MHNMHNMHNMTSKISVLQPLRAESLSSQVSEQLREGILTGELEPGQVLREMALAKTFKVSQATVREALASLENHGLVSRTPNRSTLVTNLSAEEAAERMRVRLALESLAFVDASQRASAQDLDELHEMAVELGYTEGRSRVEQMKLDWAFHQRVWELSGNRTLLRTLQQLTTPVFAFLREYEDRVSVDEHTDQPHIQLVEALRTRNADTIVEALRRHIGGAQAPQSIPVIEDVLVNQ